MSMFKPYQSKPVVRMAYEVKQNDCIEKIDEQTSEIVSAEGYVRFKHYEPVKAGDFIVKLTESDTYHCSRAVFFERNIVEESC